MTVPHKRRPLTGTERAVLSLLAQGHSDKEVGQRLKVSTTAVEATAKRARIALGALNTVHAVYLALASHQIPSTPCGTLRAYHWHRRRGDHPCAACRAAWSAYNTARRRELREERRRNGLPTP